MDDLAAWQWLRHLPWAVVASPVTAVASLTVAVLVARSNRAEKRRERRLGQAMKISARVVEVTSVRTRNDFGAPLGSTAGCSVRLLARNGSDEPVDAFTAWVRHDYSSTPSRTGGYSLPLSPGEQEYWVDNVDLPPGGLAQHPLIDITFQDVRRRRWQRLAGGPVQRDRLSPDGYQSGLRWHVRRARAHSRVAWSPPQATAPC